METPPFSRALLVVAVAALFVTPAAALAIPGQSSVASQATTASNASNESVQPGAQMAGVVGVQKVEIDGSLEGRAYGQAIAAANSNESKAAVVTEKVDRLRTRLEDLRQLRAELQAELDNGSIDRGTYEVRITSVAARIQGVERQLNRSQRVAGALPEQARQAAGLNTSAIETLRSQAGEMRGGEVAEIARSMAGRGVGNGIPDTPRGGPPEGVPGNWTRGPGPGGPGQGGPGGPNDPGPPDDRGPGGSDGDRDERTQRGGN